MGGGDAKHGQSEEGDALHLKELEDLELLTRFDLSE